MPANPSRAYENVSFVQIVNGEIQHGGKAEPEKIRKIHFSCKRTERPEPDGHPDGKREQKQQPEEGDEPQPPRKKKIDHQKFTKSCAQ